jgi:hypothetical protein
LFGKETEVEAKEREEGRREEGEEKRQRRSTTETAVWAVHYNSHVSLPQHLQLASPRGGYMVVGEKAGTQSPHPLLSPVGNMDMTGPLRPPMNPQQQQHQSNNAHTLKHYKVPKKSPIQQGLMQMPSLNTKAVKEEKKRREKRKILKRRMTLSR